MPRTRLLASAVALLAVLASVVGTFGGATAARADGVQITTTALAPGSEESLVVVGVGGLRWPDVSRGSTPTLWRMIGDGSVASLNVRTAAPFTCPLDAWLTLSAGRRVASTASAEPDPVAPAEPEPGVTEPLGATLPASCTSLPRPVLAEDQPGVVTGAVVPGWATIVPQPDPTDPTAMSAGTPGTLGELLGRSGACTTGVGPGAAAALAGSDGRLARYVDSLDPVPDAEVAGLLTACPVAMVDAGVLPDGPGRHDALDSLDATLRRLTRLLPEGTRVVVAGIAGSPLAPQGLQVVVDWTSGESQARWLSSEGTRTVGVVQLVDLTATAAESAGVLPEEAVPDDGQGSTGDPGAPDPGGGAEPVLTIVGHPLEHGEERRMNVARTVENRQYVNVLSQTIPALLPVFLAALVVLLAGAVTTALWTGRRRLLVASCLLASAAPVAASLATLSRWWVWPAPTLALTASVAVGAVVAALAAWVLSRALPASPWRLVTAAAAVTWLVLTVDGLTGTTLQQGSLLGPSPALGARFYGFTNMTFAVYATAGVVLAAGLAAYALRRGRRLAVAAVVAVGVVTTVVDGGPRFGADLGGILALVPGFTVLALLVGGVRITARRLLAVAAATLVIVAAVAVADWLAPGASSHLGAFVQRVLDGEALGVIAGKAAGAWATVAHPAGVVALLAVITAAWAVLHPTRFRISGLADAYGARPVLRHAVVALVVVAGAGSALNDSGVAIAGVVLLAGLALMSLHAAEAPAAGLAAAGLAAAGPPAAVPRARAQTWLLPATTTALGGGLLVVLLLASAMLPGASGTGLAGEESHAVGAGADVVGNPSTPLVVVGTAGLRWGDVRPSAATGTSAAPALTGLLTDGADAAGVALPNGAASRCAEGGWLTLSAGRLAEVSDTPTDEGWVCPPFVVEPGAAGSGGEGATAATVAGWDRLTGLQAGSAYAAILGSLGDALRDTGACATAVGPGAAVALAASDGTVDRYLPLDDTFPVRDEAFACPVTVVDAGSAILDPVDAASEDAARIRADAVAAVDAAVRRVVASAPTDATILVVDTASVPGAPLELGVALMRPSPNQGGQPGYLASTATRTAGVVRIQDVPVTLLTAAGTGADGFDDTPIVRAEVRPAVAATVADELADLTSRDHLRRAAYVWLVDVPFYAGIVLAAACLVVGVRATRSGRAVGPRRRRAAETAALLLAALPVGGFLASLADWWRFPAAGWVLVLSTVVLTACVAGLAALAPRHPPWVAPGVVAAITFLVLTVDALIGTPLNRAAPLGSAPTYGARFYGFGNPTFSVYAVAAVVFAAALAQSLVVRGRRVAAALAVTIIAVVAMAVDVWPTLGADLGGGLVLVPAFVVVGLAASGLRLTFARFAGVALAGVALVGAVGVLDWLQPTEQRSHLGRFVGQVIDGEAWATLARKAGYALRSVLGGVPVWITVLILVAVAVALFAPASVRKRVTPHWFLRTEQEWPLLRPAVLAVWTLAALGSVVNDFGVRIAMIALIPAVPLILLTVLRTTPPLPPGAAVPPDPGEPGTRAPEGISSGRPADLPAAHR